MRPQLVPYLCALVYVLAAPLGLALAALWRPRRAQVLLLLACPVVSFVLAMRLVPGLDGIGWLGTVLPYVWLVVLPLVPWRRRWARVAIPLVVLVEAGTALTLIDGDASSVVLAVLPAIAAAAGLQFAWLTHETRVMREAAAGV